jgi:hypothetical protein
MGLLCVEKVIGDFKIEIVRESLMESRNNEVTGFYVIPAEK